MKTRKYLTGVVKCLVCASALVIFPACVAVSTISGVKPVYPHVGTFFMPKVDSLQPEFTWKPAGQGGKYDVAVWDSIPVTKDGITVPERRKLVYQKDGVSGCAHRIEIVLQPDSDYFWSIRESGSPTWSSVTLHVAAPTGSAIDRDMFQFHTPKAVK